jgi:diguanylate cyclase (GGDEF)-like protein
VMLLTTSLLITWVANSTMEEKLRALATLDPLTNTFNRRAIEDYIEIEFSRARRTHSQIAVLMMDIDNFKDINDRLGHQVGDKVMQLFANIVKNNIGESDLLARWGGDEFLMVLPDTNIESARELAQKLKALVSDQISVESSELQDRPLTVSIGVAGTNGKNLGWSALISRADRAMYAAKTKGRNQVVLV